MEGFIACELWQPAAISPRTYHRWSAPRSRTHRHIALTELNTLGSARMIAYYRPKQELQDIERAEPRPSALSRELFHGLTPEQFDVEAKSLAKAQAMTPSVRGR